MYRIVRKGCARVPVFPCKNRMVGFCLDADGMCSFRGKVKSPLGGGGYGSC